MSQRTTIPRLGEKFGEALTLALELHGTQVRKGGGEVPYMGHLLSVAGLVIEAGGSEEQAIAALLHDAAEDAGGQATLVQIEAAFGAEVAGIVAECSDTFETPKPPWLERKQAYIDHLAVASDGAVLVSLADKLDNARAIARDLRIHGDSLWDRFNTSDPAAHRWYYESLQKAFQKRRPDCWMVAELGRVVAAWPGAAGEAQPVFSNR